MGLLFSEFDKNKCICGQCSANYFDDIKLTFPHDIKAANLLLASCEICEEETFVLPASEYVAKPRQLSVA